METSGGILRYFDDAFTGKLILCTQSGTAEAYCTWEGKYIFLVSKKLKKHHKSDNLQYDTLGCWVDGLIQASDGPSIILID